MLNLDFNTDFKVGDIVWTCGTDKLLGGSVRREKVEILRVKKGPFKYEGRYVSDGETGLFMEDELTKEAV